MNLEGIDLLDLVSRLEHLERRLTHCTGADVAMSERTAIVLVQLARRVIAHGAPEPTEPVPETQKHGVLTTSLEFFQALDGQGLPSTALVPLMRIQDQIQHLIQDQFARDRTHKERL